MDGLTPRGVLASPVAIEAPISYIAAADLAEVAVRALAEPDLASTTIELGGPRPVTYREPLPKLSRLVGQDIRYALPDAGPDLVERCAAGIAAALETLPPAVRRVREVVIDEPLHALDDVSADASVETSMGHGEKPA